MAIHIEVPTGDWVRYVPKYRDNRDDPDPVTMEIRPLTAGEWRQLQRRMLAADGNLQIAVDTMRETISSHVRDIRNLAVNGEITTGKQLADCPLDGLLREVHDAITDASVLSEYLKKSSVS